MRHLGSLHLQIVLLLTHLLMLLDAHQKLARLYELGIVLWDASLFHLSEFLYHS